MVGSGSHGDLGAKKSEREKAEKSANLVQKKKDIAAHYNSIVGDERQQSPIFEMRRFHNWIKSALLTEAIEILTFCGRRQVPINVLDLCCGKGGDLKKFRAAKVNYLAAIDIADACIDECKQRYSSMSSNSYSNRIFGFEAHVADLSRDCLSQHLVNKQIRFNLASCQFSLHYMLNSFESINNFVKSLSKHLAIGGIFICTIPNAAELVRRLRSADGVSFGNDFYTIEFNDRVNKNMPDLFGEEYHFMLDKVVNLPEYLVHFETLKEIFQVYGFDCIFRTNFSDYLQEKITNKNQSYNDLFKKMDAFSCSLQDLQSNKEMSEYVKSYQQHTNVSNLCKCVTIDKQKWEISTLYDVVLFMKNDEAKY